LSVTKSILVKIGFWKNKYSRLSKRRESQFS